MKKHGMQWIKIWFVIMVFLFLCPVTGVAQELSVTGEGIADSGTTETKAGQPQEGLSTDILVNNLVVEGENAGSGINIRFRANVNTGSGYTVARILGITPVLDAGFPFETTDEAYKVISGTENVLDAAYSFVARGDLATDYYPVTFQIMYERTDASGASLGTYIIPFSINVKINEKKIAEVSPKEEDVYLKVKKTPTGTYGEKCKLSFTVKGRNCTIDSVTPVVDGMFPFETEKDAYRSISGKQQQSVDCKFNFKVRSDVASGYQAVSFAISYHKDGQAYDTVKSINIKLAGKKENTEAVAAPKASSTPRFMVTGYEILSNPVYPNKAFSLKVQMENTSKKPISNVKITLESEGKEFIPAGGVGNVFLEKLEGGEATEVIFDLLPSADLLEQTYSLLIKTEYENEKSEGFASQDTLYIPVALESRVAVTDVIVGNDNVIQVGDMVEISASINNLGAGTLYNVLAKLDGDNIQEGSTYIGNIEPGKSGVMDTMVKAIVVREGNHIKNRLLITYEDKAGNVSEQEVPLEIFVSEPVYSNLEKVKDETNPSGVIIQMVKWILFFGVIVVSVLLVNRRQKKKQQELEEFMK